MINLVLTMAGKYERFRLFGNKVPKYLMPLGTRTVLWHVIKNLSLACERLNVYLIANERDIEFEPIVKSIMKSLDIPLKNIIYIKDTNSQLESAYNSRFFEIDNNEKIVFANIDTVLLDREGYFDRVFELDEEQGLLDTFYGESHQYSYAQFQGDKVSKVIDKMPISNMACSGLYGFGSGISFFNNAAVLLKKDSKLSFTELYNLYVKENNSVYYVFSKNKKNTIVLGTPEEYITNLHRVL